MKKILIVDDDPVIRKMLDFHISKNLGYETILAENGKRAIEELTTKLPDMVLMDMSMPEMDGITAVKEIRKNPDFAALPILMVSSEVDKAKWVEALSAGANDFVQKPADKSEMLARITTHLKVASLTNELAYKNALLTKEKSLAYKVQQKILPQNLRFEGLEIGTFYKASNQIGGDFYDAWETSRSINFIIGDVSGHSISSALLMAAGKGMLHSLGQTMHTQMEVVTATNRMLCEILEGDMFISLVYVAFVKQKNELQILSAGHNPVFLINGNNIQTIMSTGPVLGWDCDDYWEMARYPFNPGDSLFLYTDGLTEAKNISGDEFGEARLQNLLQRDSQPQAQIEEIFEEVKGFCGGNFADDLTMFSIKRTR